jgi:hypothetical protein
MTRAQAQQEDVLDDLLSHMASPPAQALHQYVLAGERDSALEILVEEGLSSKAAARLYAHCAVKWGGTDVDLVEIPLVEALATVQRQASEVRAADIAKPRYLLRHGQSLFESAAYFEGDSVEFYKGETGPLSLTQVKQMWAMVPRPRAAGAEPVADKKSTRKNGRS